MNAMRQIEVFIQMGHVTMEKSLKMIIGKASIRHIYNTTAILKVRKHTIQTALLLQKLQRMQGIKKA
jgi:hypothetical protein